MKLHSDLSLEKYMDLRLSTAPNLFLGKSVDTYNIVKRVQWDNAYNSTCKLLNKCKILLILNSSTKGFDS